MRKGNLGLVRALVLGATAGTLAIATGVGCSSTDVNAGPGGSTTGAPTSGATNAGQTSGATTGSGVQGGSGMQSATGAPSNTSGSAVTGGGTTGGPPVCTATNVAACGGDVAGTWNVASSCLELSGDMDVTLTSLGCATVPVTGYLQTTGTFIANPDGSYTDNTTTTGVVSFPLEASCLSISSVAVECDRIASIFAAVGWTGGSCSVTDGLCGCDLTTQQQGGMGAVLPYTETSGQYTTMDNTLTASNASYAYCAEGDTLTVTPQASALTGTVVLQREGTAAVSTSGGMNTTGGANSTGGMGTMGAGGSTSTTGEGTTGSTTSTTGNPVVGERPCDIYATAGNMCVAAHSTVRALFASYEGALYQVKRSDGQTQDIGVLSPGGFADSSMQDSFCGGSSCTIWRVYDQSGNGNFLEAQTPDSTVGGNNGMSAANAAAEQLSVGGNQVYSLFTRPAQAYWNDGSDNGMPLGAEPQGIYMVTSGEHFNGGCCYNYGNAQLDRNYHGGPTMDAVYFGNNTIWGTGAGDGPWVMADMEDGMLAWGNGGNNPNSVSLPHKYVTAMEKNNGTSTFALKGGDATQPSLTTMWDGALPGSKSPMQKEGAVILGAGGDCCYSNNNASEGTFYEGAIVSGYPSDATDEAIHANIVETGYGQ